MQVHAAAAADVGDVPVQIESVCRRVRLSLSLSLSPSLSLSLSRSIGKHNALSGNTASGRTRGEMATPMRCLRQGVWCLLPVVFNAVPIHTQYSDHYLRDEASWL